MTAIARARGTGALDWLQVARRQVQRLGIPCIDLGRKTPRYKVRTFSYGSTPAGETLDGDGHQVAERTVPRPASRLSVILSRFNIWKGS